MTPVGPLPSDLGQGGSGFHGEVAVRVRQLLEEHAALVTAFNALLVKLDADSGDTGGDNDYSASLALP